MNITWNKPTKEKTKGRSIKMQAQFSEKSEQAHIIDMIETLQRDNNWTQPELMFTAFQLLHDEWRKQQGKDFHPLHPNAHRITTEMETLTYLANEALKQANEILAKIANGALLSSDQIAHYQGNIRTMQSKLNVNILEGAANFSSEAVINDDDSEDDWS